uniref:Uncharacterized protein n=1 Tax=Arundo donax TaxID=35708 RepID=A0A0A8YJS9_ARUDO
MLGDWWLLPLRAPSDPPDLGRDERWWWWS